MNVTLKHKAADKQNLIRKAMQIKIIAGAVSKQIKDCFEAPSPPKNIIIPCAKNKKIQIIEHTKHSLQTTASSFSTRHQSAQKYRRVNIANPEAQTVLKQNMCSLNSKSNSYTIKWRNPVSSISKSMRVILGEWLMQLSCQLGMPKDAVYNALHYTDKYVGMVSIPRSKYQSIGLCALFIASKLELSAHANINTFVQAMDGTITKSQLIALEQNMLLRLKFKLNPPTLYQYMILLISLFNHHITKNNPGFPTIAPNSQLYRELLWILDGVHLDNEYKQFHSKEKTCLAVLYLSLKKFRVGRAGGGLKRLSAQLEGMKVYGEIEKIYESFLASVIQVYKKLSQIKDCIVHYRKWVKYERMVEKDPESQIEQLKAIILNE